MNARFGTPAAALAIRNGDDRFKKNGERYGPVELQLSRGMFGSGSILASHFLRGSLGDVWLEGTVLARFVQNAYSSRAQLNEIWLTLGDFKIDATDPREFMQRREETRKTRDGPGVQITEKFEYDGQRFRLGQELAGFIKSKLAKEGVILQ